VIVPKREAPASKSSELSRLDTQDLQASHLLAVCYSGHTPKSTARRIEGNQSNGIGDSSVGG
jgi:hypothetical protein